MSFHMMSYHLYKDFNNWLVAKAIAREVFTWPVFVFGENDVKVLESDDLVEEFMGE